MLTLAFDIGGTKIHGAVVDDQGQILMEKRIATPTDSWGAGKKALLSMCEEFRASYRDVAGIGIACAGPLHAPSGQLFSPTNINWGDVQITRELSSAMSLPAILENDAAAAVLAEAWLGEFKDKSSLMAITLGTGLGIGITVDHKLVRGRNGLHPEGGHMILDIFDAELVCACENAGCAEGYLSGSHFLNRARRVLNEPEAPITEILQKATSGDSRITVLFERYSQHLAQFLYNDSILFYPDVILLSGSFAKASGFFLEKTQTKLMQLFKRREHSEPGICPKIHLSKIDNAGLLGAASLVLNSGSH
jgi:glucokinase